jgi:two-component system, cell cycle sensor histidine kinase and response regulator CckA
MLRRVWDWFAFAPPAEDDAARDARNLRLVAWALIGASVLALVFEALLLHRALVRVLLWNAIALLLLSEWLTRHARLALARFTVMLVVLGVLTVTLYTGYSGIHSVTTMMLPAVIVVGAMLLSRRGFLVITVLTVASAVGLVVADIHDFIHTPYQGIATYYDVIAPALYLIFTALLVRVLAVDLTRSLDRARRNARELAAANARLEKQADALEQSEARWRAYIEEATDLVFILDTTGRVVSANRTTCTTLGYAAEELVGRNALELCEPDDQPAVTEAFRTIIGGGRVEQVETRARTRDGRTVVLDLRGRTLRDQGRVTGTFHIGRDITERRRLEEERARSQAQREREEKERHGLEARLQQAHKLESLGRLAGGIAHDFNNLLMAILGNIDLALDLLPHGSPAREPLVAAGRASGRATDLTRQMLACAGRGKFSVETFDLSRLIEETADILRASVSKKAELRFELATGLPPIRGDASQIRQILMNVVVNASEALGDLEGSITITTTAAWCSRVELADHLHSDDLSEGRYVHLEVRDTGPGMDPQTVARVFDPFFTTKFTGRGLGLAVVLGIARGHKAAVRIDSAPGRGTTFRVLFPSASMTDGAALGLGAEVSSAGSGVVLLVDDEEDVRRPARAMLERLGYQVVEAGDGREAMSVFAANRSSIRCVLLDLSMPHMDGEETFRALRASEPAVRVIVSSGYGEQDTASRFADAEPAAFIQKPYTLQRLGEVLSRVLATG